MVNVATMPPREGDPLLGGSSSSDGVLPVLSGSFKDQEGKKTSFFASPLAGFCSGLTVGAVAIWCWTAFSFGRNTSGGSELAIVAADSFNTGPYALFQNQIPSTFLNFWEFYAGEDSVGSAGYQVYVGKRTANAHNLVTTESSLSKHGNDESITIRSAPNGSEPRLSIRLEGKHRFNTGLFIIDVDHIPTGCGVWPALWLTDETNWPNNGEIDFIESVNLQNASVTALHTSSHCNMYAQVPEYSMTGTFDRATGIPNTFTGVLDTTTNVPADNCWTQAAHQWANQGCVVRADPETHTVGQQWNEKGGGVYALEWDPAYQRIRSWAFPAENLPDNVVELLEDETVEPATDSWGLPYARFAIGEGTGCSADHFRNMRLVLNTAFCGTVAGNRFAEDGCASNAKHPVEACNAYIASQPSAIEDEAYWKIRSLKVYQRT